MVCTSEVGTFDCGWALLVLLCSVSLYKGVVMVNATLDRMVAETAGMFWPPEDGRGKVVELVAKVGVIAETEALIEVGVLTEMATWADL